MADKKISAATLVITPAATDEYATNQGGASKRTTRAQVHALQSGEHFIFPQVDEIATPTLAFGDADSGFDEPSDDVVRLSLAGIEGIRWTGLNSGVVQAPFADVAITALAGGGQGGAGILINSYNNITVAATTGDSVTLPVTFAVNSLIHIKNNGANDVDVFPGSGDDLGAGADTAVSLAAGDGITYLATVANTTWAEFTIASGGGADPLLLGAGTVGAPTYSFSGDPDSGVFSTAADQLGLVAGGKEIARVQEVAGAEQFIISPGFIENNAALPALAFGDGDTGFFEESADLLVFSGAGIARMYLHSTGLLRVETSGFGIFTATPSATVPNIVPARVDPDTGMGTAGLDELSLIAGGKEIARCQEVAGAEQFIVSPGFVENNPALPALAFGDGDTGFYESADDTLRLALAGVNNWVFQSLNLISSAGNGPKLAGEAATVTNPTLIPHQGSDSAGIGGDAIAVSLISSGVEVLRARNGGTAATRQVTIGPAGVIGAAATPSLAWGDGDTGFRETSDDVLVAVTAGADRFKWSVNVFGANQANGPAMLNVAASATVPTFVPDQSDPDTGLGTAGADILSFTAGGKEIAQVKEVAGAEQFIVSPGFIEDNAAAPSLAFGDGDTGFYERIDDQLNVSIAGSRRFAWVADSFQGVIANSGMIRNVAATATVPTIHAAANDPDTGLGSGAANQLAIIASGVEVARAAAVGGGLESFIIAPALLQNDATKPSLAFGDGDTGFYENLDDFLSVSIAGVRQFVWGTGLFQGVIAGAGALLNEATSATNPTLVPGNADFDTGIGSAGADQLSLIAGALDCINISEVGSARQIGFYVTAPVALQTGVAVSSAGIHAALVSLGLITA